MLLVHWVKVRGEGEIRSLGSLTSHSYSDSRMMQARNLRATLSVASVPPYAYHAWKLWIRGAGRCCLTIILGAQGNMRLMRAKTDHDVTRRLQNKIKAGLCRWWFTCRRHTDITAKKKKALCTGSKCVPEVLKAPGLQNQMNKSKWTSKKLKNIMRFVRGIFTSAHTCRLKRKFKSLHAQKHIQWWLLNLVGCWLKPESNVPS